jgi:hypothetical protein
MQCDLSSILFVCVVLPVACAGVKRARDCAENLVAICKVRKVVGRAANHHRGRAGLESELRQIDDPTFLRMFRMDKDPFFALHAKCSSRIKPATPLSHKMAALSSGSPVDSLLLFAGTIRWLAGGSMWDIAFMFRMSYKTIHAYKYSVVDAINHVLRGNIVFPQTPQGLQCLADGFASICSGKGDAIAGVVAAVDSVCVQRKAPSIKKDGNMFTSSVAQAFNRKGYFATTVLAFVDANLRFLSVSMSCYSSSHDSTLFSCSSMGHLVAEGKLDKRWIIVGDDAFVCKGNVITPYVRKQLSPAQRNYNYFLSMLRQVVERAFGLWKWKWGIFWRPLCISEANIKRVLECTLRLHNFCIDAKTSTKLDDFIVHDDIFWTRTSSNSTRKPRGGDSIPYLQPVYADAATIAAHTGISTDTARERSLRQRVCQSIVERGLQAPDISLRVEPARAERVCGMQRDPKSQALVPGPYQTQAVA